MYEEEEEEESKSHMQDWISIVSIRIKGTFLKLTSTTTFVIRIEKEKKSLL
jgi:hypothetical protein